MLRALTQSGGTTAPMNDSYSEGKTSWPLRSLLAMVPASERADLVRMGIPRRYDRGEILMHAGEAGREAFLIIEGCAKVLGSNVEGNPALLAVRMAGEVVGELSVLDGKPRSATVQAATPTRVRVISSTDLQKYMSAHPATAAAVQNNVTAKLREAIRDRIDLTGAPVVLRLARVICKLGSTYGEDVPEGIMISAPLSQADLSSLVGTTEQSIRRALGSLRDKGLVRPYYRKLIITDMNRLQEMTDGRISEDHDRRSQ
jgi:CRP/FNR family transcriptional regulator, cyclic AMP receptor protein